MRPALTVARMRTGTCVFTPEHRARSHQRRDVDTNASLTVEEYRNEKCDYVKISQARKSDSVFFFFKLKYFIKKILAFTQFFQL